MVLTAPTVVAHEDCQILTSKGSFYFAKAFAEESVESTETDALHYIASATKLVTTVAVMQCVEKGLLDLDANIAKVLPEWENPQVLTGFEEDDRPIFRPSTKPMTLRQVFIFA
jgi:CubicO group peptidase (beta-lactamase class C family)